MKIRLKLIWLILINVLYCSTILADNQSNQNDDDSNYDYKPSNNGCSQIYDPYEKINRKIFVFNSFIDHLLLRPITIGYKKITNDYTKARVSMFLSNINTPVTIVNYALQIKYDQTMKSVWRFLINSTFGIGGLFDVATKMGLTITTQTFGSTLARYGVGPGPYLVIPFLGGTNARDVTDSVFTNNYFNPIMYVVSRNFEYIVTGMEIIDGRLALLPFTDYVERSSIDPYIALRSASQQNRESVLFYPDNFQCPKSKDIIK
jgi:phospholipid-binding lipoprotein MlaA